MSKLPHAPPPASSLADPLPEDPPLTVEAPVIVEARLLRSRALYERQRLRDVLARLQRTRAEARRR